MYFLSGTTHAQFDLRDASTGIGVVEGIGTKQLVPYPELQAGGSFGTSFLEWSAYWGSWNDDLHALRYNDAIEYSYSGHILGARLIFLPASALEQWPVPIALFVGAAHQVIARRDLGGEDLTGTRGSDGSESANTLEAGLRAYARIGNAVELRAEAHQFFRLGSDIVDMRQTGRRAYTLGCAIFY